MKISRANGGMARIDYVIRPSAGGHVPLFIMKRYTSSHLNYVVRIQEFLQGLRSLEQWGKADGVEVGEQLVSEFQAGKKEADREARVTRMMEDTNNGLKEAKERYDWLESMLVAMLKNKLRPAGNEQSKLCVMSEMKGKVVGAGLASSLASSLTAHAAVDEWVARYPAMRELDKERAWFRPMIETVAQRLLEGVGWGLKMRLYIGAGLSMMDMCSDIFMIKTYWSTPGREAYGDSLAAMVAACIIAQLLIVYAQNRKGPKLNMLKEFAFVLTATKSGIDASRVAKGVTKRKHAMVASDHELTAMKGADMVFESSESRLSTVLQ
jgi:hypothetical protein